MENTNNPLDQLFKEKLGNHEVPYNSAHWREMESKLDSAPTAQPPGNGSMSKVLTIAGGVAAVAVVSYLLFSPTATNTKELVDQETPIEEVLPKSLDRDVDQTPVLTTPEVNDSETAVTTVIPAKKGAIKNTDNNVVNEVVEHQIDKKSANNAQQRKSDATDYFDKNNLDETTNDPSTSNFNNPALKMAIATNLSVVCTGQSMQFSPEKELKGVDYLWNFGDGGTSIQTNPTHAFTRAGKYTVTLIVSKGEKNNNTSTVEINVLPSPKMDFTWESDELTLHDPYVKFTAQPNGQDAKFSWEIENVKYSKENVEHAFHKAGSYDVQLIAKADGCETKVNHTVEVQPAKVHLENAFTLNGDGLNDIYPKILPSLTVPFQLQIRSKTNKLLYETTDPNQPWNGRINNNGDVVSQDIYICIIITKDKYGREHIYSENFNLLRY
jgi:PKD repeat protein